MRGWRAGLIACSSVRLGASRKRDVDVARQRGYKRSQMTGLKLWTQWTKAERASERSMTRSSGSELVYAMGRISSLPDARILYVHHSCSITTRNYPRRTCHPPTAAAEARTSSNPLPGGAVERSPASSAAQVPLAFKRLTCHACIVTRLSSLAIRVTYECPFQPNSHIPHPCTSSVDQLGEVFVVARAREAQERGLVLQSYARSSVRE